MSVTNRIQGRLLSPRVLHFGRNQLFWECRFNRACETFPHYLPSVADRKGLSSFKDMSNFDQLVQEPDQRNNVSSAFLQRWYMIYEKSMAGKLSHQTDRIMAFCSAASEIRLLSNYGYFAGLWRCELESKLTWMVKHPELAVRSEIYRAPSWSWLSIDGEVKAPELRSRLRSGRQCEGQWWVDGVVLGSLGRA